MPQCFDVFNAKNLIRVPMIKEYADTAQGYLSDGIYNCDGVEKCTKGINKLL